MNILLLGDDCIDVYNFGTVNKISQEAPVPIFNYQYTNSKFGMVSNVENNLLTLGANVFSYKGTKSIKTRLIDLKFNQQILRIDQDMESIPFKLSSLEHADFDCIVICDYNKGFISYDLVENIKCEYDVPIFIDSKKHDIKRFEGCFVKINNFEYENASSLCSDVIVTHGGDPVKYKNKEYPVPQLELTDVCGAGDTFLAALVYDYMCGNDIDSAISFAIDAASITVQHLGVYSPRLEEILHNKGK